jgi:hypothetical protein
MFGAWVGVAMLGGGRLSKGWPAHVPNPEIRLSSLHSHRRILAQRRGWPGRHSAQLKLHWKAIAIWSDDKLHCRVCFERGIEVRKSSRHQRAKRSCSYNNNKKKGAAELGVLLPCW